MYFDLYLPFPQPETTNDSKKKKDKKGKGKEEPVEQANISCWEGLEEKDKREFTNTIALAGHLGYSVVGCTIAVEPSTQVNPSPFRTSLPFPALDPRAIGSANAAAGPSKGSSGPSMVQVTRFHMRLDDSKTHAMVNSNTNLLQQYDILSVQPTSDKALQLACNDLCAPGPNQLSIITLPLHERPYHFRLNRKQIKQAQRNGVMFEITYAAGLFPPAYVSSDTSRKYRQNFMSNAREIIRITEGKNVILSSGPGGSTDGFRGPQDIVNLEGLLLTDQSATMLGMPANLAKDAVSLNPKRVLLNAQARKTHKAVLSVPVILPPLSSGEEAEVKKVQNPAKRSSIGEPLPAKKQKMAA